MTTLPQTTNVRLPRPASGQMQIAGPGGGLAAANAGGNTQQGASDAWRVIRTHIWLILIVTCIIAPAAGYGVNYYLAKEFPRYTSPFWNMKKKDDNYSHKIDVIINGHETIGSAERSSSVKDMTKEFYTISEGKYAQKLFDLFGRDRVEKELGQFLSLDFFPRSGGGIGLTRMINAYNNLIA